MIDKFLERPPGSVKAAIFLSGSGSNAEQLLEDVIYNENPSWIPAVLVTDRPERSRAREIADYYDLPLVEHDIREFYQSRGESRISILTEAGQKIREAWTRELRKLLKPHKIDFGIMAGFIPLTNITADFPCLNVHPGDLTVEQDSRRLLVGLHTIPIEIAILKGLNELRSSVLIVQTYSGAGGEMDSGPILGISEAVPIDLQGVSLEELKGMAAVRPEKRPIGGYKDRLEEIAVANQEKLKENGDWVVFPKAVEDFAAGNFACQGDQLYYHADEKWQAIETVEYSLTGIRPRFL